MKYNRFLAGTAMLMLAACTAREVDYRKPLSSEEVFYARIEDASSKVFADADLHVRWDKDDRVSIFNKYTFNQEYRFTGETGDNAGAFKKVESGDFVTGNALDYVYSVYPYKESTRIGDDGQISLSLPSEQTYRQGSFGRGANTMISVTEGNELLFKNLCGYLVFKLYGEGVSVSSLELRGNSGERLAGPATVTADLGATPTVTMGGTATEVILLTCASPVPLGSGPQDCTEFWLAVPPLTFQHGFTLTVTGPDGAVFERTTSKSILVTRNTVSHMAAAEVELEPLTGNIQFADANVKAALLEKGIDTDGDGEISYEEAAAVTTVEKNFLGSYKSLVTSFDEFKYFTSVTKIGDSAFQDCTLVSITLPESVTSVGSVAFVRCRVLKSIRIPDGVIEIGDRAFLGSYDLTDVQLPASIRSLGASVFAYCTGLEEVAFPQGYTTIGDGMFSQCTALKKIMVPASVTKIGSQAFNTCTSLVSIIGGEGLQEIGFRAFEECTSLKEFHIPETVTTFGDGPFFNCTGLERFTGKYVTEDERAVIKDGLLVAMAFSGMANVTYEVPPQVTRIGGYVFYGCSNLASVSFHERVVSLGDYAFAQCTSLKDVVLPSRVSYIGGSCFSGCTSLAHIDFPEGITLFEAQVCYGCTSLEKVTIPSTVTLFYNNVFADCTSLTEVTCKATVPPSLRNSKYAGFDKPQDSFTNTPETMRILVPSGSVDLYKNAETWSDHADQIVGVDFPDMENPDFYISSDYSEDGTVFTIQEATEGAGINIVIMGDCFVDIDIADGSYRQALEHAVDVFFEVEPYASYRHLFNVYGVNVVSMTEGYSYAQGKLGTWFGSGTAVGGNDGTVRSYAQKALPPSADMGSALIIVMMNRAYYAGTCYMYYNRSGDYGQGLSIAYFPLGTSEAMFAGLIQHEAGGHGFAKLSDEYSYSSAMPGDEIDSYRSMEPYGWWKNVDFTSDETQVKWHSFLADSRYNNEPLGVFEGACTYATGAYRPTENSIMRYNTGGFNAPSREAIYYRIHKLAYGDSWTYDREAFVAYDVAKNLSASANAARKAAAASAFWKSLPPLAPPVVIDQDPGI